MKNKKQLVELQAHARAITWPNDDEARNFEQFSRQVRERVRERLLGHMSISAIEASEAMQTWEYDASNEQWRFTLERTLAIEIETGLTKHCEVRRSFSLNKEKIFTDLALALDLLRTHVEKWCAALQALRVLQLKHVLATDGQEAYLAAVERGM